MNKSNPIKVNLITHPSSATRGIGFYESHLIEALNNLSGLSLTADTPDVIHYTFFDLFYPTLKLTTRPTIVTIHDLTPLVLPKLYPKGLRGRINLFRQKNSLKKVSAVLTDSENSKSDIADLLGLPPEKIFVTPLAVDPHYHHTPPPTFLRKVRKKYHLPEKFVLYVGGVNPNKNLVRLIEATLSLEVPLVLVGSEFLRPLTANRSLKARIGLQKNHPELSDALKIHRLISDNPLIYPLGFVPTDNLAAIYRLATLYCQPSLYEGFGLPLLEAMTSRCLVVSSNTSSLPEIYPPATLTFAPTDLASIKSTLDQALNLNESQRKNQIETAFKKAQTFSWDTTAKLTADVYSRVCHESHS